MQSTEPSRSARSGFFPAPACERELFEGTRQGVQRLGIFFPDTSIGSARLMPSLLLRAHEITSLTMRPRWAPSSSSPRRAANSSPVAGSRPPG
jgi:hypothetical protein